MVCGVLDFGGVTWKALKSGHRKKWSASTKSGRLRVAYNKPLTDQEMDYIQKNISLPSAVIAAALGRSDSSVNRYKQKMKHSPPSAPGMPRYVKPFKEWRPTPHPREADINQHPKMISLCSKVRNFNES